MSESVFEDRRNFLERLWTLADILGIAAAYMLAVIACLPDDILKTDAGDIFVPLGVMLANALELLLLLGIHLSLRQEINIVAKRRFFKISAKRYARYREFLLPDSIIIMLFWLTFRAQSRPLLFLLLYLALAPLLGVLFHSLLSGLLRCGLWRQTPLNLLVVGANKRGEELYRESLEYPFLGFSVIGFVDDVDYTDGRVPLLGRLADLLPLLREKVVDLLVLCLPIRSHYDATLAAMRTAEQLGITCELLGSFFPNHAGEMRGDADGRVLLTTKLNNLHHSLFKRPFDLVAAGILLIAFSPVMLLASLATKLSDGGPLFFVQPRVGLNKRIFNLYKFRSMVVDAEQRQLSLEGANEMDGPVFKIAKDPRVTRVGRLLRKYNIDELPQLFNVLRGEMSIVGPRPMSIRDYSRLTEDWTRRRFTVKPGLTCLWQVMPNRNSMSFAEWMMLDMRYIENNCLWEDVVICLKTVPAMLRGSGI